MAGKKWIHNNTIGAGYHFFMWVHFWPLFLRLFFFFFLFSTSNIVPWKYHTIIGSLPSGNCAILTCYSFAFLRFFWEKNLDSYSIGVNWKVLQSAEICLWVMEECVRKGCTINCIPGFVNINSQFLSKEKKKGEDWWRYILPFHLIGIWVLLISVKYCFKQ